MLPQEYFINSVSINEIRRQATYRSANHPSSCLISSENARLHKTACKTGVSTHVFYTKHLSEFIFIVMVKFRPRTGHEDPER